MTEDSVRHNRAIERSGGLLRLVCVSVATRALRPADIERIDQISRARNAVAGITGLVIIQEPFFYGVMEGPEPRLLAQMEAVITDPVHRNLRVLREQPIATKRFLDWRVFRLPGSERSGHSEAPPLSFVLELAQRLN